MEIIIKDKQYGWQWNMAGASEVAQDLQAGNTIASIYAMLFGGMFGDCIYERKKIDFTYRDIIDHVNSLDTSAQAKMYIDLVREIKEVMPEYFQEDAQPVEKKTETASEMPGIT